MNFVTFSENLFPYVQLRNGVVFTKRDGGAETSSLMSISGDLGPSVLY